MKLPVTLEKVERSSNMHAMAYDQTNEHLYVQFRSGGDVYRYREVPPNAWNHLQAAESKGAFLQRAIKPNYMYDNLGTAESEEAAE